MQLYFTLATPKPVSAAKRQRVAPHPPLTAQVTLMFFTEKRWKHFAAMALIGDGVMAVIRPEHDAKAWKHGPKPWQKLMGELQERPTLTRVIGIAQIVGGIWWALEQEREESKNLA
jgi:hypothetical protein